MMPAAPQQPREEREVSSGWSLSPHACRTCLGRILEMGDLFRCATCGAEAEGTPDPICGCGMASHYCGPNPRRGVRSPAEIVILRDGVPVAEPG